MEIALTRPRARRERDVELIRSVAAGDEAALRALYTTYGRRLFAYAYRLTNSRSVAEEVLQDSLLAAWQGARRFRGQARVLTWLLGIVHHQALNATRRKRLPRVELDEAVAVASRRAGPEAHTEAADRRRVLQAALQELSPDHRAVIELVFFQGLRLAEVAEVCACPLGTVKSRLSCAKARLREALAQAGLGAEDVL